MMETNQKKQNQINPESIQQKQSQPKPKKPKVDPVVYDKFINLFFVKYSGAKLKDEAEKELESLKSELLKCSGKVAKMTRTAAIDAEKVRIVEGIPVPEYVEKIIKGSKNPGYYLA